MAITKISPDVVDFDSALVVSPTLTIGDATAEDTKIVFDGNAQDFYIGLDDSADDLIIGLGSTVGTTPIISVDENKDVAIPDGKLTITESSSFGTSLELKNTSNTHGSVIMFNNDSSSPADSDYVGAMIFNEDDSAGNSTSFAKVFGRALDVTDGTEDGELLIELAVAGSSSEVVRFNSSEAVFNEASQDIDFRVESDTNANSLFLEGSTSHIGLGTGSPDDNGFGAGHGILAIASATGSAKTAMLNLMGDGNDTDATRVASVFFNDQSATGGGKTLAGVEAYRASNHATDPGADLVFSTNVSGGSYAEKMRIHAEGYVTMPLQPAFNAYAGTAQDNLAVAGSGAVLIFDTERFDIGSNYNTSNGTFTAPVTGKYQLSVTTRFDGIDPASSYIFVQIVTSNSSYYIMYDHGGTDSEYFSYNFSILADMDASDTAYVSWYQSGGSATADFVVAGANRFTGVLVC